MKTKICFKCDQDKSLTEFYKHSRMSDGHLNKCKDCTKSDVTQHREFNIERIRAYDKKRSKLPHRVEHLKRNAKKMRQKYPQKYRARQILWDAIKNGSIKKMPCIKCGDPRSHGHHEDYNKPLDVVWLCYEHHHERHKKIGRVL